MTDTPAGVTGGVDCHADTHSAAVIDDRGRMLATAQFCASADGYQQLTDWLHNHGRLNRVGIEGTGSYGAGLTRYLQASGITVVEVNRPHPHTTARRGKTDALDAEAAARKVLAGECTATPKDTTGVVEAVRQLLLVRTSAVKSRTAALNQFGQLLVTAPTVVRESLTARGLAGKAAQATEWTADPQTLHTPTGAAQHALGSLARRIRELSTEADDIEVKLTKLVAQAAPRTLALPGVGAIHTAQMLTTAGQNLDRFRAEGSFARLCAATPIPASSGRTDRHRLNPYGDRQANRALHMMAIVRLRCCERTRTYADRRATEGLSKKDIIRCLKRYIARELYYTLRADLKQLALAT